MTAFIVIAVIVLIFAFFLNVKIRAEIKYLGGEFDFKVKYLWFTIFPFKKRKEKKSKVKKKKSKQKNKSEAVTSELKQETEEQTEKGDENQISESGKQESTETKAEKQMLSDKIDKLKDIIEKVKLIWSFSQKHLKHIFKRIYLENLMIDFIIADEDAYAAAMNYGKVNAAVYNLLNAVRMLFPVSVKTVDIACDFEKKESVYDVELNIIIRPATVFSAAFGILFGLLKNIKKIIGKSNEQPEPEKAVSV